MGSNGSEIDSETYASLLRLDFHLFGQRVFAALNPQARFLDNFHLQLIAAELEECRHRRVKRLIINIPPRSMKSIYASVAFPAWLLGHDPGARIMCVSYAHELAIRLAIDTKTILQAPFYRQIFPGTVIASQRRATADFMTTVGGERMAVGVGGAITGRGGDFIIVDDPMKAGDAFSEVIRTGANQWFDHTLLSRLNDKQDGVIIVIMQRLHLDDLTGHLIEQGGWKVLALPAIALEDEKHEICTPYGVRTRFRRAGEALHPEREPLEMLREYRKNMSEYAFSGQYQQEPVPVDGAMVKPNWFRYFRSDELPTIGCQRIQSWDTASKQSDFADYSVGTSWVRHDKNLYLVDVVRAKMEYPDLKRMVHAKAQAFQPDAVLIEDKASGIQLVQELREEGLHAVKAVKPKGDKIARLVAQTPVIENGHVYLPEGASWLQDYVKELSSFPATRYNDQVDSTSQALEFMSVGMWENSMGLFCWYRQQFEERKGPVKPPVRF